MRLLRFAALLVLVAACHRDYVFAPTTSSNATIDGKPASDYQIPPEAPHGDVRVATMGLVDIHPHGAPAGESKRGLHVRMVIANNSSASWSLDTREQRLSLPTTGESRPAYATVDRGSPPLIEVPAGQKRTVDLFYPLPAKLDSAKGLPAFDTVWSVRTDTRVVAERTPFGRLEVLPPSTTYVEEDAIWGPSYWYDPYYMDGAFPGVGLAPAYVERPVVIRRRGERGER